MCVILSTHMVCMLFPRLLVTRGYRQSWDQGRTSRHFEMPASLPLCAKFQLYKLNWFSTDFCLYLLIGIEWTKMRDRIVMTRLLRIRCAHPIYPRPCGGLADARLSAPRCEVTARLSFSGMLTHLGRRTPMETSWSIRILLKQYSDPFVNINGWHDRGLGLFVGFRSGDGLTIRDGLQRVSARLGSQSLLWSLSKERWHILVFLQPLCHKFHKMKTFILSKLCLKTFTELGLKFWTRQIWLHVAQIYSLAQREDSTKRGEKFETPLEVAENLFLVPCSEDQYKWYINDINGRFWGFRNKDAKFARGQNPRPEWDSGRGN